MPPCVPPPASIVAFKQQLIGSLSNPNGSLKDAALAFLKTLLDFSIKAGKTLRQGAAENSLSGAGTLHPGPAAPAPIASLCAAALRCCSCLRSGSFCGGCRMFPICADYSQPGPELPSKRRGDKSCQRDAAFDMAAVAQVMMEVCSGCAAATASSSVYFQMNGAGPWR